MLPTEWLEYGPLILKNDVEIPATTQGFDWGFYPEALPADDFDANRPFRSFRICCGNLVGAKFMVCYIANGVNIINWQHILNLVHTWLDHFVL